MRKLLKHQVAPELTGPDQQCWLDRLHAEAANLYTSLAAGHSLAAAQLRPLDQVVADAVALAFERVG
jgi:hypothetical protein